MYSAIVPSLGVTLVFNQLLRTVQILYKHCRICQTANITHCTKSSLG